MPYDLANSPMSASREYPSRPIVGVGVVVQKDGAVLLIQRGQEPGRGRWSLPGGMVEIDEHLQDAAVREVREECGIEVDIGDVVEAFDLILRDDYGRAKYHYVIIDFAGRYVSGDLHAARDVMDARWVMVADLTRYPLNAKTSAVIEKALGQKLGSHNTRRVTPALAGGARGASSERAKPSQAGSKRLPRHRRRSDAAR